MIRFTLLTMMCIVVLAGCQSMPWEKKEPMPPVELLDDTPKTDAASTTTATPVEPPKGNELALASASRFKEVPLPEKATEDLERSYVYESAALQIGRMVYSIKAPINDVARFYIQQCPAAGWKMDNVQQAVGKTYILFTKPGKRLEVTVEPMGMGRGNRLTLHMVPAEGSGS